MIVNGDSRVINKLEASFTDDARVIIYNHHLFIVQATGFCDMDIFVSSTEILKINQEVFCHPVTIIDTDCPFSCQQSKCQKFAQMFG
jgi:hypothetical protein